MITNDFLNHLLVLIVSIFAIIKKGATSLTVSDQIGTNTNFYFRRLNVFPSKLAAIEFSVNFNTSDIAVKCVPSKQPCRVYIDIYTTKDDANLKTNCSNIDYGQLLNEDLHSPLRPGSYRFTTSKLDDVDSDMLHCKGRAMIQDYVPRNYGFSFGYDCMYSERPSLRGLSFNVTISEQTNKTTCIKIPEIDYSFFKCHKLYNYSSLPSMIGIPSTEYLEELISESGISHLIGIMLSSNGRLCHKYARELLCHIISPKCYPVKEEVIHPCKETLAEFF